MSTEYAHLNDSRPELMGGLNQVSNDNDNENKPPERIITVNENKFMNMSLSQIFSKIVNILPNMYNDYYKKHIETKVKMRSQNNNSSESNIFRETMRSFIFENENMIYLGILILIIVFFLYIIN
jgi:hypothetical protein